MVFKSEPESTAKTHFGLEVRTGSYLPAAFTFLVLCVLFAVLAFMTLKSDRIVKRS